MTEVSRTFCQNWTVSLEPSQMSHYSLIFPSMFIHKTYMFFQDFLLILWNEIKVWVSSVWWENLWTVLVAHDTFLQPSYKLICGQTPEDNPSPPSMWWWPSLAVLSYQEVSSFPVGGRGHWCAASCKRPEQHALLWDDPWNAGGGVFTWKDLKWDCLSNAYLHLVFFKVTSLKLTFCIIH